MEKYYNDFNTVLKEPTSKIPYTEAISDPNTRLGCPKIDLINVSHELPKKSINIYFEHATPEYNYACYLEEESKTIWDVDFVHEGNLIKISGVVNKIEYDSPKLNDHLYSHSLNGVLPPIEAVVIRFDCSMENKSKLVSIDISKIRHIKYSKANIINEEKKIVLPKFSYYFMERKEPVAYKFLITSFLEQVIGDGVLIGDGCFSNMMKLTSFSNKLSFPLMISADEMFKNTYSLQNIEFSKLCNLKSADKMFFNSKSIKKLELDMPKIKCLNESFAFCESLEDITIKAVEIESGTDIFKNCNMLKNVYFSPNSVNFNLEILSPNLTPQSITNILKSLKTDREILEDISDPRIVTFCDNTICPEDAIPIAINAMIKGHWEIRGLYDKYGKKLQSKNNNLNLDNEDTNLDEDYPDDLVKIYEENNK